jgi:hypothetical protein
MEVVELLLCRGLAGQELAAPKSPQRIAAPVRAYSGALCLMSLPADRRLLAIPVMDDLCYSLVSDDAGKCAIAGVRDE